MTIKKCSVCFTEQPEENFEKVNHKKGGFTRSYCRSCQQIKSNESKSKTPEMYLKNTYNQLKSKRKDSAYEWNLEVEHLYALWNKQHGRCALSGHNMTWHRGSGKTFYNASLDRKNPDLGYTPDNIQLVCTIVNMMKQSLSDVDFIWWCKSITENTEKFIDNNI